MCFSQDFLATQEKTILARIKRYEEMQDPDFTNETPERKAFKRKFIPILLLALGKIFDGTYGVCLDCQTVINKDRLLQIPAALRCTECQTIFEVNNDLKRT